MRIRHGIAGLALFLFLFAYQTPALAAPAEEGETIAEGVYAGEVYIGTMTREEAAQAIDDHYQEVASSPFTVTMEGQPVTTTLAELGLSWDSQGALDEAEGLGKSGPVLYRYKTLMDLKYGKVTLEIPHQLDESLVQSFVETQVAALDQSPENATITRRSGEFQVTQHKTGLATNQEATVNGILTAVQDGLTSHMQVAATVDVTQPSRTYEALSQISDKLGTANTYYGDSKSSRKNNVEVAAGRLNGQVLMPGESLSVSDTILPREPENGYEKATQYSEGETVEAYGGGVCQVSSTLYNALLDAELRVTERAPHSMIVSYMDDYAMDAAIAAGYKDLVFENNLEHPIYIAASADGDTLLFNIYGVEYRPSNRTKEYVVTVVDYDPPQSETREDPNMYVGETRITGSNKPGVTAYLEKVVYEDGEEVSRTKLHTDTYAISPLITYVGTKPKETQPVDATTSPSESAGETTAAGGENGGDSGGGGDNTGGQENSGGQEPPEAQEPPETSGEDAVAEE